MNILGTKRLTTDAVMMAFCAVLGYISLDLGSIKLTFESLPVLLGALLFGPLDGFLIGGMGTLIYQLLRYGIAATTLLWILPYALCGLIVGFYSRTHNFRLTPKEIIKVTIASELFITALNTFSLFVDSHLYGYYTPLFILGPLPLRLIICIVKAAAFGLLLPTLTQSIRKVFRRQFAEE